LVGDLDGATEAVSKKVIFGHKMLGQVRGTGPWRLWAVRGDRAIKIVVGRGQCIEAVEM
jgi:threonine dehydrogenase-like Zn-dependent dehydrogenase